MPKSIVTYIDLFAGLGGIRLGFSRGFAVNGIETKCLLSSEIKDYAIKVYQGYYGDEDKPFYVGQGTLQRAFVFSGNRRNSRYNEKAINVDLIKVEIVEIDITPDRGVQLEKELVAKYKLILL